MTGAEAEAAARLLERLLSDPEFRGYFRRNPVLASREAGLASVAEEMAMTAGKAMETLDGRESRSSLAGVFMAAAFEGAGMYDFSRDLVPHLDGIPKQVEDVLSRVHTHGGLTTPAGLADVALPGAGAGAALADNPAAPPNSAGAFAAITPEQAASGRHGSDEPVALLHSKRVHFDADGIADLKAGKLDPRLVSVVREISRKHAITISATASGHQAVDIATVDGKPVSPGNAAARQLAIELSALDPGIRPTAIGSPWALPGAEHFTDAEHQDRIHVGFDDPVAGDWKPPEQDAVPAPAAAAASGAPAEPGGLEDPGRDTNAEADDESGGDDDDDSSSDDESDEEEDDDGSDGEQPDADDGSSGDGSEGGDDGDHDDNSDGTPGSGGESSGGGGGSADSSDDAENTDSADSSDDAENTDSADSSDGADDAQVDVGDAATTYPGNDAPPAQIAAWMAGQAQKRGLPAELPVMAALTESSLHNLDHGDADSVGYFQMRKSVWGEGAYAGYQDDAELQLKWFLDQAESVKRQRIAAGSPVDDPNSYGDWIADVERPRVDYRGRYQPNLEQARELLRRNPQGEHGKAGSGSDLQVEPAADPADDTAGPRAVAAVAEARKYMGTPYQWGGSTPKTGFDCSGLVQWAYAKAGIRLPRTSEQQILADNGTAVDRGRLEPGDLVFFRNAAGDVHHVGISLGGDRFINAPHTGARVRINSLKEPYFASEFAGGRRFDIAPDGGERPSAVEPDAAARAEAALARDAAEAQRPGTLLFRAVRAQELRKLAETRALNAIDPSTTP